MSWDLSRNYYLDQLKALSSVTDVSKTHINIAYNIRDGLTTLLVNTDLSENRSKSNQIGVLQLGINGKKDDLKKLKDELIVAEEREKGIKNRNIETSNSQTFGYLFRPFRRISYAVIAPLIFIMICISAYLVLTAPKKIGLNSSSGSFNSSSSSSLNNFNKIMRKQFGSK
jgi:hypothetical protein